MSDWGNLLPTPLEKKIKDHKDGLGRSRTSFLSVAKKGLVKLSKYTAPAADALKDKAPPLDIAKY